MITRSSRSASLASAFVFLLAAACSRGDSAPRGSAGGPFGRGGADRETVVAVVPAELRDLARTVTVTGPIEPIRTVSVNAHVPETVSRTPLGD
jgi:multidrug efflux pump subunit AcrA (membrane-fusion protein)